MILLPVMVRRARLVSVFCNVVVKLIVENAAIVMRALNMIII